MIVTAKDIAREVNLSQPTVSRILSGDPNHRVAAGTRQRVLEAARQMGYQPNAVARSLRRGRTHIVGLYTSHNYDARNDFLSAVIGSLQRACERQGLDLLLHSARSGRSAEEMYGKLRDGRIDGLILHAGPDDPLVEILIGSPLPVVAVADPVPALPAVTCDDADGMRQLVGHLWERGHRRLVFLCPEHPPASVARRREQFLAELARRDVPEGDGAVMSIDYERADAALPDLLRGGRPIAVCCWNDRAAYNLLHACRNQGVRVPEHLAVAGFDGFRDDKDPASQLVTVDCPWANVAATALDVLSALMENRSGPAPVAREICLPVTLLAGNTV